MAQSMDSDIKDKKGEKSSGDVYQCKNSIQRGVSGDGEDGGMAVYSLYLQSLRLMEFM